MMRPLTPKPSSIWVFRQMTAAMREMMAPPGESIDGTQQDAAAAAAGAKRAQREKPAIALITAVGAIVTGKGAVGTLQQVQKYPYNPLI